MSDTELLFEELLTPYRSLPPAGFLAVTALLIGLSVAIGIDIFLVFNAFWISYDAGRRSERIRLTVDALEIECSDPSGAPAHAVFQPFWSKGMSSP